MAKHNLRELDQGQLQTMWNFLKLQRKNTCTKGCQDTKRASGHHPASNGTENSWSERYRPRYIC